MKKKTITLLVLGLNLSLTGITAQTLFAPSIINPFNLSDIGDYSVPAFVDIDSDGDKDLFVGSYLGSFYYFENIGTVNSPDFQAPVTNPFNLVNVPNDGSAPTFGDIDNDGDFDIISGNSIGDQIFYENIGTDSIPDFQTPVTNPFSLSQISGGGSRPKLLDVDGDGDIDVISGAYNGFSYFFENTGTLSVPSFEAKVSNPFGIPDIGDSSAPAFSDWDFDNDLDVIIGKINGNAMFYENIGTASAPSYSLLGGNLFGVQNAGSRFIPEFVDIDNDGDEDLFVGNFDGQIKFQEFCATYSTNNIHLCDGATYTSPSTNYVWSTAGTYFDTIPNTLGCDSLMTFNITVGNTSSSTINATYCTGYSYTSPSGIYSWSTNGTYYDTIPNASGCDSLMTINLVEDGTINCGLVAYYPFDNDATDASGNGNNGVETNIIYDNDTCQNPLNAASFDANNPSYVNIGKSVKPLGFPVSMSCWINASDIITPQWIFRNDKWESGVKYAGFTLRLGNGSLSVSYGDNTGSGAGDRRTFVVDSAALQANGWHHVVVNINGKNNFEVYIDTVLVNGTYSGTANSFAYNSTVNGFIGVGMASQDGFTGLLDEFRVHSRALTKPEIDALYMISCATSINNYENEKNDNFFFPNPATDRLYFNNDFDEVRIYNITGKLIFEANNVNNININSLIPGIYIVEGVFDDKMSINKLIVQ